MLVLLTFGESLPEELRQQIARALGFGTVCKSFIYAQLRDQQAEFMDLLGGSGQINKPQTSVIVPKMRRSQFTAVGLGG